MTSRNNKAAEEDAVLRRMLATPPEPHTPRKAAKPKAKPKKKPAK